MTSRLHVVEEHLTSERMRHVMFVYVLNAQGKPLMPCQPRKARLLLKAGKTRVVRMVPFTLQLLSGSSGYTQDRTHQEHTIARTSKGLRDAIQMGMIRWRIFEQTTALFADVHLTYGYLTKCVRSAHGLEKSHLTDARCISGFPLAQSDGTSYLLKCVRRNNRQFHKATIHTGGKRQRNTAPKEVHGFRLFDYVTFEGKTCFVFGRRSSGYFDLRRLAGTKIHASASHKRLRLVQRASACLIERRSGIPPTPQGAGLLLQEL